jgi:hypothetical protein
MWNFPHVMSVGVQKVSNFGAFQILDFQIREAQLAVTGNLLRLTYVTLQNAFEVHLCC